jgi:hypothetical protein
VIQVHAVRDGADEELVDGPVRADDPATPILQRAVSVTAYLSGEKNASAVAGHGVPQCPLASWLGRDGS